MIPGVSEAMAAAEAALTAPGAPFEMEVEGVLGEPMRVFKRRARSLREVLAASEAFGDAEYLIFSGAGEERRITYREHLGLVASAARSLRERYGVEKGDRVAILAANCPEWIIAFWAVVSLGAVAVGLNAWWTGPEIRWALGNARPRLLIADSRRLARLAGDDPGVPVLSIEESFASLLDRPGAPLPDAPIAEDDPAVVLYTSGTTGRPKGAVSSHRNVIALIALGFFNGARMAMVTPPPPGSPPACQLVTSPLFHVSGLHCAAVTYLAGGIKSVWLAGRFDAGAALHLIERERVTGWAYTRALLHRLVHSPELGRHDLSSIRQLGGGGSPIPPSLFARTRQVIPAVERTLGVGYGLTECSALATLNPGEELPHHAESAGRPLPTVAIEIRDVVGRALGEGQEGEIHIRSPLVMLEYFENPQATAEAILPGRWLRTGDIGRMEGGRLYLASRKRDLILRGGENVYPVEIELCLEQHPGVAEAAVIGVDHPELGEEVKAVVVPKLGTALDPADLAAHCREALAYFKVPAHWEIRGEPLPRNALGKVMKHALRGEGGGFVED